LQKVVQLHEVASVSQIMLHCVKAFQRTSVQLQTANPECV